MNSIVKENKEDIKRYIKEQRERKKEEKSQTTQEEGEDFTFEQDLKEVMTILGDVMVQINKLQQTNEEIKDRVKSIGSFQPPEKTKELHDQL